MSLNFTGTLKSIGVSNYTEKHLEELLSHSEIKPAVLQIEHHPHLQQTSLIELCQAHGIHFQAYSSLGTSSKENQVGNKFPKSGFLRFCAYHSLEVPPPPAILKYILRDILRFWGGASSSSWGGGVPPDRGAYAWWAHISSLSVHPSVCHDLTKIQTRK